MFWDRVAGVYDVFAKAINRRAHGELKRIVAELIEPRDTVLECACGTGLISGVIAEKCERLVATDISPAMLKRAEKNCATFPNVSFQLADITALEFEDGAFDKVVASNVIHLLDEPLGALREMNRVCRPGGILIIPTYMNKNQKGKASGFASAVGKAGADFKRQFTVESYRRFFEGAGYDNVRIALAEGRIPCAVAVMNRKC